MEKLEKGEKVLMYVLDEESADPLVYGEFLIDDPGEEVMVERCDNILGFDIVTVRDIDGNRWCGSHIEDKRLGRICFIRKEERIHALRDIYDALYLDLNAPDRYNRLKKLMDVMGSSCDHAFVTLKNRYHELSVMQCVHCGLTNLWEEIKAKDEEYLPLNGILQLETFDNFLLAKYGSTSIESTSGMNILSHEAYQFKDLKEAYRKAIAQNPEAAGRELFELMKKIDQGLERRFIKDRVYPYI